MSSFIQAVIDNVEAKARSKRIKKNRKARKKGPTRIEFLRANLLIVHCPKQKRKIIKNIKKLSKSA